MTHSGSTTNLRDGLGTLFQAAQAEVSAWSQEGGASLLIAAFALIFAVCTFLTMADIAWTGYSVLPWGDMWGYWIWYLRPKEHFLVALAAQHNEHRIAVARLFFLADQRFFQGRAIFIFICIFLIQFFHAILLWRLARLAHSESKSTPVFLGSAAFVCLFSAQQYTNFTWAFQIQFVAVYFAVTSALTALMILARLSPEEWAVRSRRTQFWLVATIVIGIIASYSMANGLLVWPLLFLAACWFRVPRRERLILLAASITMWALYLRHYKNPTQHSSIREGLLNLPQSFAYALCVLGSPLDGILSAINRTFALGGENWRLVWSASVGLMGLIAGAFISGYFIVKHRKASRADVVIVHLLLFTTATALLIGLGRVNFPLKDALQSRYTTPALLFWFCILFLFSSLIARNSPARNSRSFLALQFASTVILVLAIGLYQPTRIRYAHDTAVYLSEVEAAFSAPVYDEEVWGRICHDPKAMIPVVRYLQEHHLSVFASERLKWLGDPLSAHYKAVTPAHCTGSFDDIEPLAEGELPGFRVRGWAWDTRLKKIARSIVFTNKQGQIIGFGYTGFERPDVLAEIPEIGSAEAGWKGYIAGLNASSISAYMVTDAGLSSCLIGTREITAFISVPFERLGEAPTDIPVKILGGWVKDGYYPGSQQPPVMTSVFGSWVRSDADTGTCRLGPFRTGSYDVIALPVLTGPLTKDLSVVVVDASNGAILAELSPPPILTMWRAWKIPLPHRDMLLAVVARDQGSRWGEWLAVGMPYALK